MDQAEMVKTVADSAGITEGRAKAALSDLFDQIALALRAGDTVRLFGLGSMVAVATPERPGTNPGTGKPITIAAGHRIKFRPSSTMTAWLKVR